MVAGFPPAAVDAREIRNSAACVYPEVVQGGEVKIGPLTSSLRRGRKQQLLSAIE